MSKRGIYEGTVISNKKVGERFYRLSIEFEGDGAEVLSGYRPGQFIELDVSGAALPRENSVPEAIRDKLSRRILLRRPFVFCETTSGRSGMVGKVLYGALGPATWRMTTLSEGDSVSVMGPLGSGFRMPKGKKCAALVSGGMGAGPSEYLAQVLTREFPEVDVTAFAGAKTSAELPFESRLDEVSRELGYWLGEYGRYGIQSVVSTDDGSLGFEGVVTECFEKWLSESGVSTKELIVYCCGPEEMLARIADMAADKGFECQVSMERMMGCGVGVCQSCAVRCRGVNGETVYKLCCKDGPVFDSREVIFEL